jgi:hypothetical protein
MELAKASPTLADVEMTRVALERQLRRLQAIQKVRRWWIDAVVESREAQAPVSVWAVQQELESRSPELSDFVGIVLDDLEDRGIIRVADDGTLERESSPAAREILAG